MRAKVQEFETKSPEDPAPVLAKIKTLEERNADLEKRIALVDYEQSQEFATKYDQPYRQMWQRATSAFSQLTVKEPAGTDETTGEPVFRPRHATEADLVKLGALPLSELDEAAAQMFGPSAPRAVQYIERLRDLAEAKQNAIAEAQHKAGEWKSQREMMTKAEQKARDDAWRATNKALEEKFPKAFKPEEGNTDDASAHTKGFALSDLVFLGQEGLTPEQIEALPPAFKDTVKSRQPLTPAQRVKLHAIARLKMANHDRQVARVKKLSARVAELEKTLADYEQSEPSTSRAGHSPRSATKPWDRASGR